MWCVPKLNGEFIERMEDVLNLYSRSLNAKEPVVCLDERPVVLHDEKRKRTPARPGKAARYDYEYLRCGTANIFAAIEPRAGKHMVKVTKTRKGAEFAKMLMLISRRYCGVDTIHLVVDNLSTHSRACVVRHYGESRGGALWAKFTVHFTPKHGSWLNQAEIEIGLINRQCLGKRRFPSLEVLHPQVQEWTRRVNRQRLGFSWKFTTAKARSLFSYNPVVFKQP